MAVRRYYGNSALLRISWPAVGGLCVLHAISSWLLLRACGEVALADFDTFLYFWASTGTTIGYGDYSPGTELGRYATILWIMPGGIMLFSTAIAKISGTIYNGWTLQHEREKNGMSDYHELNGHIVIIGYRPDTTPRMIELLRGDHSETRDIIIIGTQGINPLPDQQLHFVRTTHLTEEEALHRAACAHASLLLVYAQDDNETLAAALAAAALNEHAHLVCYFSDSSHTRVLQLHCPHAEVVMAVAVENMVRTAQDPGSSRLVGELLNSLSGQTQYSIRINSAIQSDFDTLLHNLRAQHNALIFGLQRACDGQYRLNPDARTPVGEQDVLYYMAPKRLHLSAQDWQRLTEPH